MGRWIRRTGRAGFSCSDADSSLTLALAVWNAEQTTPIHEFDNFSSGEGPTGIRWLVPLKLEVRYSQAAYFPGEGGTNTFTVWRDEKGVWKNDYKR